MKKILLLSISLLLLFNCCLAQNKKKNKKQPAKIATEKKIDNEQKIDPNQPLVWHTDLQKANEIAKKTNKIIFGFFTGSDWCGWCKKLQNDVFAKPEFIVWAKEKVVLLELDFPRYKQLPQELQQQNGGLKQALTVNGFPTIWLFNLSKDTANNKININPLGSLGYPSNAVRGKEEVAFLETANSILVGEKK